MITVPIIKKQPVFTMHFQRLSFFFEDDPGVPNLQDVAEQFFEVRILPTEKSVLLISTELLKLSLRP